MMTRKSSFAQRREDLFHSLRDWESRVHGDGVFQAFRETCFHLLHLFLDLFCNRQGVGSGDLINANNDCGFSVETTDLLIDQRTQLDTRNILQSHRRAIFVLTDDNAAESSG